MEPTRPGDRPMTTERGRPTRLGLLGLLAVVLVLGGPALGLAVAVAAGVPTWLGQAAGFVVGFAVSTVVLRRAYARG